MEGVRWLLLLYVTVFCAFDAFEGAEFCVEVDFIPSYKGTVSTTLNGLTCQRWDSQHPHKHHYTDPSLFPDATLEDVANYCRTPDGSEWPWCFTTSPEVRSEFCHFDVNICASGVPPGCYTLDRGIDYKGKVNKTISGIPCQRWSSQTPQTHGHGDPNSFVDDTIEEAESFCRNPEETWGYEAWPWCYTLDTETRWEFCYTDDYCVGPWCFSYFNKTGGKYRGRVNVTATGKPCKRWDNESLHNVGLDPAGFPDSSLEEAANFCRNSNGSAWPWCYTMTDTRWEYCAIEDIVCRTFLAK